ncbi:MAG TPA: PAS domain S-box protein [Leptolyngbyaceae cyanobacterium]
MKLERFDSLDEYRQDSVVDRLSSSIFIAAEVQPQVEKQMGFEASLLNHISQAVIATDRKGRITYWNRHSEILYQWQASEVISENIDKIIILPQKSSEQARRIIRVLLDRGQWTGQILLQRKDGNRFWVEVTYSTIKESNGKIAGFVGIFINISNSKETNSAWQPNQTTQFLLDAIPDAIFLLNKDGIYLDYKAPPNFKLQLPANELLGKKVSEILPKPIANKASKIIKEASISKKIETFEYQINNGKKYDFEARIVPVLNEEIVLIVRDVTERKQAERQLAKSEERYRIVSELTSDFAYAARIDSEGRFITDWITGAFSRISGFSWEEIKARNGWQTLIHPDDMPIFSERLQTILCWQSDISEYRIFTKEGKIRWLRDYSQPVYCDDKERVLLIYGAAQDITERKQAEEALRQQTERERLLGMMQERIRQSLNVDEIISQAVAEVRSFLQVERVAIYQIDRKNGGKFIVESIAPNCSSVLNVYCNDTCFNSKYIEKFQQGQISAIDDIKIANVSECHKKLLEKINIRANLVVPIVFNKQLWGLLCAHQCSESRHWQPFEIELLQNLASTLALAIQQSSLFKQISRLNAELESQVQERTAQLQQALELETMLKRITDKVRDSLDENQILQTAVRELATGLNISSCNAAIYDLEKGTSTIRYEYAVSIPGEQGRVAQMGKWPEIYNQLLRKEYFQFCSIVPNPVRGLVSMFTCPIFDNEGVLGDLWLINHKEYAFRELEIRLVQQVANQCAIAIRQARLYRAEQARVAELEKLNLLKDDFLSTVSHELRTPMANMKMAIQMLKIAPSPERQERYLQILKSECDRETELINDLLDLQRLEAESYPLSLAESVNLQEWLPSIVEPFLSRVQERSQNFQFKLSPNVPPLLTDRAGLGRIVVELLNNACKYTPSGGGIILQVEYYPNGRGIGTTSSDNEGEPNSLINHSKSSVTVHNQVPLTVFNVSNEVEIPVAELPHLFRKFYRVLQADLWKQGGTGLGLALVQKLVEQMGGNIKVESGNGWTHFDVELPHKVQENII